MMLAVSSITSHPKARTQFDRQDSQEILEKKEKIGKEGKPTKGEVDRGNEMLMLLLYSGIMNI